MFLSNSFRDSQIENCWYKSQQKQLSCSRKGKIYKLKSTSQKLKDASDFGASTNF